MPVVPKKDRLSPPIMLAFRNAYDARDGRNKLDLRDESGERVIASRRTSGRTPISESLLRREVAQVAPDAEILKALGIAFDAGERLALH